MASEILARRSYNSRTWDEGAGVHRLEAHVGHIHYKDTQGDFQPVDYTLEDMGTYWRMERASYRVYIAKDFGATDLIRFENKFEGAAHIIYYEPRQLVWVNQPDLSDMQVFRSAQRVQGVLAGNKITWTNAFGNGLHFELTIQRSGFKKELVIQAKNRVEAPPTANHRLVVLTRYRGQGLTVKAEDLGDWDGTSYYESERAVTLRDAAGKASWVRPAYIYDSAGNSAECKVFWKLHSGSLWQAKVLPSAALSNGVYPLRADTTTQYYSGAGDGRVEYNSTSATWDTVHNATDGTSANYTDLNYAISAGGRIDTSGFRLSRGFIPIDTSGLPDDATISSASLYLYKYGVNDSDNDGDDFVVVVQTSQASTSQLTTADYDQCGAVHSATEGCSRSDITGKSTGAYESFALNATGLTWISKTGTTMLGIREGHDIVDSAYASSSLTKQEWAASESTSADPYLDITYYIYGAATMTGTGSMTGAGVRGVPATAAMDGLGAMTGVGVRAAVGAVAMTGTGVMAAVGLLQAIGQAAMTGLGAMTATAAGAVTHYGAAVLGGLGDMIAVGVRAAIGAVSMTGTGGMTATGFAQYFAQAVMTGVGYMSASAVGAVTSFLNFCKDLLPGGLHRGRLTK